MSQHSLYVEIRNQDGALYEKSERINPINRINFEIQRKYFLTEEDRESCDANTGCGQIAGLTNSVEKAALQEFYSTMQGTWWQFQNNWNVGDPCLNFWYGITCNKKN